MCVRVFSSAPDKCGRSNALVFGCSAVSVCGYVSKVFGCQCTTASDERISVRVRPEISAIESPRRLKYLYL